MNNKFTYLFCLIFLGIFISGYGQFYGGDHDGFDMAETGMSSFTQQAFYCSGGDFDGFNSSATDLLTLNINQDTYCEGGNADGFSTSSPGISVMNDQEYYSMGGNADGFSSSSPGLLVMNEQALYSMGGIADGFSSFHLEITQMIDQVFYSMGGAGDGFSSFNMPLSIMNPQAFYCQGGNRDGYASSLFAGSANDPVQYCNGGIADGWTSSLFQGWLYPQVFCLGGDGDGWKAMSTDMTSLNTQGYYCSAGSGDGYDALTFSGSLQSLFLYCLGGQGDGYHADTSGYQFLGYGIWTGAVSNDWALAANWKYNTLPTPSTNVLIPSGAPFYPVLTESLAISAQLGIFKCKRLDILNGGSLTARRFIRVRGILNVDGTLNFQKVGANTFSIFPEGQLHIGGDGNVYLNANF